MGVTPPGSCDAGRFAAWGNAENQAGSNSTANLGLTPPGQCNAARFAGWANTENGSGHNGTAKRPGADAARLMQCHPLRGLPELGKGATRSGRGAATPETECASESSRPHVATSLGRGETSTFSCGSANFQKVAPRRKPAGSVSCQEWVCPCIFRISRAGASQHARRESPAHLKRLWRRT
jgi:hypothetical protein